MLQLGEVVDEASRQTAARLEVQRPELDAAGQRPEVVVPHSPATSQGQVVQRLESGDGPDRLGIDVAVREADRLEPRKRLDRRDKILLGEVFEVLELQVSQLGQGGQLPQSRDGQRARLLAQEAARIPEDDPLERGHPGDQPHRLIVQLPVVGDLDPRSADPFQLGTQHP